MLISATQTAPNWWRQRLRRLLAAVVPSRCMLTEVPRRKGVVCLTFDDGPDPAGTAQILDILKSRDVKATFFVIGRMAEQYPELLVRIRDEGHEIGHHSWTHSPPGGTSAKALTQEVRQTTGFLKAACGVESRMFRPPHGKLSAGKLLRLWGLGQTVVLWNHDPGDVFQASPASLLEWARCHPPRSGDIILLHDHAAASIGALPDLIDLVQVQGLRPVTLSEALR